MRACDPFAGDADESPVAFRAGVDFFAALIAQACSGASFAQISDDVQEFIGSFYVLCLLIRPHPTRYMNYLELFFK